MILAGGKGTRLGSLTVAVNKHLLPVGDKPMIMHSFELLHRAKFRDVLLVTNAENVGDFMNLIQARVHPIDKFEQLYITPQHEPAGIADAIRYGEGFCNKGPILVLLGDNVFEPCDMASFRLVVEEFEKNPVGAHIWTTRVDDPKDYGILELDQDRKPIGIVEKPKESNSREAVVGAYLFDSQVWDIIPNLAKSDRDEYEVTDIIRKYLDSGSLTCHELQGEWHDLGRSVESYYKVASRMS
jgi:glucose-1-phosphate thymidylyltransferase